MVISVVHCRVVEQSSHPPTPPSCSECVTKTQPAEGKEASQSASRMWRSSNGNMRVDTPQTTVISNPSAQKTILLDHLKKEATVIPTVPAAAAPPAGSAPPSSGDAAPAAPVKVEDLGKSLIEGHEVEGKRYTLPPPPPLQMPKIPKPPPMPQMPKMPAAPAMPKVPKPPEPTKPPQPTVTEVWTSVKLKTPVLTKISSAAGERTTYCKPTSTDEPHPSVFEIPPGYKIKGS